MKLPPLPEPDGFLCQRLFYKAGDVDEYCTQPHHNKWAEDQMREYGALCRKMALEEAAKVCDDYPAPLSCNRVEASLWDVATTTCADKIRELLR